MQPMNTPSSIETIENAGAAIRAGRLVIFPTETVYGIAADPRREDAIAALLALKGRAEGHALPLIAGSLGQIELVSTGWQAFPRACALADAFWPGPLALVLPSTLPLAPGVLAADDSVAIRWSSHRLAAALAVAVGFPIVATSANRSSKRPHREAAAAVASLGSDTGVLVLDGGRTPGGAPSTLVDPRPDPVTILRHGALRSERILACRG